MVRLDGKTIRWTDWQPFFQYRSIYTMLVYRSNGKCASYRWFNAKEQKTRISNTLAMKLRLFYIKSSVYYCGLSWYMLDLVVEIIEIIKYMWLLLTLLARTSPVDFVIRVTDVCMQTLPTRTMWFPNENITGNILWAVFQQVECYTPFCKTFLIRMWRLSNLGYFLITISGKAEWHKNRAEYSGTMSLWKIMFDHTVGSTKSTDINK